MDNKPLNQFVPGSAFNVFACVWQLEHLFRLIHYTAVAAWKLERAFKKNEAQKQLGRMEANKNSPHLSTAHTSAVSFSDFDDVVGSIGRDSLWPYVERYLLPRKFFASKAEETRVIRNRTMHCREPRADDHMRLKQILLDFEPGYRAFLSDYWADACSWTLGTSDCTKEMSEELKSRWHSCGWRIEARVEHLGFIAATGVSAENPDVHAMISRQKLVASGTGGSDTCDVLKIKLSALVTKVFDVSALKTWIEGECDPIHFVVISDGLDRVGVTIRAGNSIAASAAAICAVCRAAVNCLVSEWEIANYTSWLDAQPNEVLIRGNHPFCWYTSDYQLALFDDQIHG